jgi:hypothetical protein
MTPTEIETMARRQYNAVGDTFYSQAEIMDYIYKAQMDFCKHTFMLKKTYTTTTVADQSEYAMPSQTIAIKRLEVDGWKVEPISQNENDDLTVLNDASALAGNTDFYYQWGQSFFFTTAPTTSGLTIKVFTFSMPQAVENTSTIEVPGEYHLDLVTFVLKEMALKDENPNAARAYEREWMDALQKARRLERRKQSADSFKRVRMAD